MPGILNHYTILIKAYPNLTTEGTIVLQYLNTEHNLRM